MKSLLRGFLYALAVLVFSARIVWADGIVRDSVEAISGGRGGTNIAFSDNGAVILSNPSGILNASSNGLAEIGADGLITDLHYSNPLNDDVGARTRPLALPMASYFQKSDDGSWAAGIGVFAPAGFAAGWDLSNPVFGSQPYQSFGSLLKILPAVAYRATDRVSIGATLGLAASYEELHAPFFLQNGPFAGTPLQMNLRGLGFAPTWSVGLQYLMSERTTFGLVYTSQDRFNISGHMNATVPGLGSSGFDSHMKIVWPQSVGIGVKHSLTDYQRVSLDLLWYDWADAFKSFDLTLTNASNPVFGGLLGSTVNQSIPLNWWDSVSVRLGYEWLYSERNTFRAGYVYNSAQIPSSTLMPLIPAILEHTFTIGHGTVLNDAWRIDCAYQFSFGPQREVGTSTLVGGDFSNSTVTAQAHWLSISVTHPF